MRIVDLLLIGGARDPNMPVLAAAAERAGCSHAAVLYGADRAPAFAWRPGEPHFTLDGAPLSAHAVFARLDVFDQMQGGGGDAAQAAIAAQAWHACLAGWALAQPAVRMLNARATQAAYSKPATQAVARAVGLATPDTLVTNARDRIEALQAEARGGAGAFIVKPAEGGDYCRPLPDRFDDAAWRDGAARRPAMIQPRLAYPEWRIYRIGGAFVGFQIQSERLDYREGQDHQLVLVSGETIPDHVAAGLDRFAGAVGLDFLAADFKTDPATGDWMFLEANTNPMIAAFDHVSGGAVSDALLGALLGEGADGG